MSIIEEGLTIAKELEEGIQLEHEVGPTFGVEEPTELRGRIAERSKSRFKAQEDDRLMRKQAEEEMEEMSIPSTPTTVVGVGPLKTQGTQATVEDDIKSGIGQYADIGRKLGYFGAGAAGLYTGGKIVRDISGAIYRLTAQGKPITVESVKKNLVTALPSAIPPAPIPVKIDITQSVVQKILGRGPPRARQKRTVAAKKRRAVRAILGEKPTPKAPKARKAPSVKVAARKAPATDVKARMEHVRSFIKAPKAPKATAVTPVVRSG